MDGVLADFESAFREVEVRLLGDAAPLPEPPEVRAAEEERGAGRDAEGAEAPSAETVDEARVTTRRKLDRVWAAIEATPDFWTTLKPIDPVAVRRIKEMTIRHGWEVFFITQRPRTAGETVQRQTQRWLVEQGFDWPSVLVMPGSRGKAAAVLHLDYLVDDNPKNCVDIISDSKARVLLVVREPDERIEASARRLGIGIAPSIAKCLDILDEATEVRSEPSLLGRLAKMVGWRA